MDLHQLLVGGPMLDRVRGHADQRVHPGAWLRHLVRPRGPHLAGGTDHDGHGVQRRPLERGYEVGHERVCSRPLTWDADHEQLVGRVGVHGDQRVASESTTWQDLENGRILEESRRWRRAGAGAVNFHAPRQRLGPCRNRSRTRPVL